MCVSLASCSLQPVNTITFVLPAEFDGPFIVVEESNGFVLAARDGTVRVEIPETRVLKVKSWKPLRDQHRETVQYRNGDQIVIGPHAGPDPGSNAIALRSLGAMQSNELPEVLAFFVGTKDGADKLDWDVVVPKLLHGPSDLAD